MSSLLCVLLVGFKDRDSVLEDVGGHSGADRQAIDADTLLSHDVENLLREV
jgi:hypothetical protein